EYGFAARDGAASSAAEDSRPGDAGNEPDGPCLPLVAVGAGLIDQRIVLEWVPVDPLRLSISPGGQASAIRVRGLREQHCVLALAGLERRRYRCDSSFLGTA